MNNLCVQSILKRALKIRMLNKKGIILPSYTVIFLITLIITGYFIVWFIKGFSDITITVSGDLLHSKYVLILSNHSEVTQPYFLNELSINDKSTLINIKNFKFIINHNTCKEAKPFLLMLIHSAPANIRKRNVIRETWGHHMSSITTFFLVGYSEKYKSELAKENTLYKDLIQGNFLDSYRNMTYKHVMALKWVTYYCSNAKYILKLDDDVFVHVDALLKFLKQELSPRDVKRLILCDSITTLKVRRSWRSKWRVLPKEYPNKEYPTYCAGWAILYTVDTVFLLYREAQKEPYFWIDDVHVTGTLAKKINLTHISVHSMILSEYMMAILLKRQRIKKDFIFGPPNLMETGIRALHNAVTTNIII